MDCNLTVVNSCHPDKSPIHNRSQTCILECLKAFPLHHQRKHGKKCLSEQLLRGGEPPDGDHHLASLGTGCPAKRLHGMLLVRGRCSVTLAKGHGGPGCSMTLKGRFLILCSPPPPKDKGQIKAGPQIPVDDTPFSQSRHIHCLTAKIRKAFPF